jgi:prepilin-type N-terminal cleavage/methylation domain-containing protein
MHRVKRTGQRAFSLLELLTVISIIAILLSLLMTALSAARARSRQTVCLNNLHQIGLGFTGFALDHEGKYQMDVPERLGGSMEYDQSRVISNTPFSRDFHHFAALSNEVPNVKVMVCPADTRRLAARDYPSFTNQNLSYWANTKAVPHATLATLAGDWNVYNPAAHSNDVQNINFGREVHRRKGSVLFADGRVEITRSLLLDQPLPPQPVAVTSPPQASPATTAGAPAPRQQPASVSAAPANSPTSAPAATPALSPPAATEQPNQGRADLVQTNASPRSVPTDAAVRTSRGYRRTQVGDSSDHPPGAVPETPPLKVSNRPTNDRRAADDDEPWNTSGFRVFKLVAFISYLFSLLLALIVLLLLYLRSRLAQRARERASAIKMD